MTNSTKNIKPPLVTLNTSVQEVPSQSMESFGEHEGDSGQMLLSIGNDLNLEKSIHSLSKTNSITVLLGSKEKIGTTSAPRWADLVT